MHESTHSHTNNLIMDNEQFEKESDKSVKFLEDMAERLRESEGFDCVFICATKHDKKTIPDSGTLRLTAISGNLYAAIGATRSWVIRQDTIDEEE